MIEGELEMEFEDETLKILPGEFAIVPKGVNHRPIAREEVKILLFEPHSTLNTGDVTNEFTQENLERFDKEE